MKIHRIYGMVLRYWYYFKNSYDRMSDVFYWPAMDLIIWGLTSAYFRKYNPNASIIMLSVIGGILLWIMVWRGQYEISVNMLEEVWNKNLVNIFAAPLKFSEWVVSFLILGLVKGAISLAFAGGLAFILYRVKLFMYGFSLIPILFLLISCGWTVGFLIAGLVMRFGTKVQTFAWGLIYVFAPFSAIYYPLSILPGWAQTVARAVPMSYIFEAARKAIATGRLDWSLIWPATGLIDVYFVLAFIFFRRSFDTVLQKGLRSVY